MPVMTEFPILCRWIDGWCKTVFKWIEGLRATLLVREPPKNNKASKDQEEAEAATREEAPEGEGDIVTEGEVAALPRLYVNLDPAILELVEEAKGLARLGVRIPEQVMLIVDQEATFKAYKGQLLFLLKERDRVRPLMAPVLNTLCQGSCRNRR